MSALPAIVTLNATKIVLSIRKSEMNAAGKAIFD
jgi:hypothetical protein